MKTKVILIVVVLIALLFTGCDLILETYFEIDSDEGWTKGDFKIELILEEIHIYPGEQVGPGSPIRIMKLPYYQMGDGYFEPAPWDIQEVAIITDNNVLGIHNFREYSYTQFVPPGQYSFAVWHDINNNGKPEWDEPSRLFEYYVQDQYGYGGYWADKFDLFDQETGTIEAFAWMWENDRMPEHIMSIFNEGNNFYSGPDVFDMWIDGPMIINANAPLSEARYYINTPDTDVKSVNWLIQLNGNPKESGDDVTIYNDNDGNDDYIIIDWGAIGVVNGYEYELIINVELVNINDSYDVQWRSRNFWVQVQDELADDTIMNLVIDMRDLHMNPVNLDYYTDYDVFWSIYDGNPDNVGGSPVDGGKMETTVYLGQFNETLWGDTYGIKYNNSSAGGTYIEIIIDKNENGNAGKDDFRAIVPVHANVDPGGMVWIFPEGWMFFPIP